MSDSLWPHGLYSPWNSPGQNTGVGSLSLFQGIFPTQGLNPGLPNCRRILNHLSHQRNPWVCVCVYKIWDDHVILILYYVNIMYHIDWFAYTEESLHPRDKAHFVMIYDHFIFFNIFLFVVNFFIHWAFGFCLLEFCWEFSRLCSSVILACDFLFFCGIFVWFWN